MAAITYPALSINPFFPIEWSYEDSVIRSDTEGGYQQTRQRFTRTRRQWTLKYDTLGAGDKALFENFFVSTISGGSAAFNWTHPTEGTTYEVRFAEPPKLSFKAPNIYSAEFTLKEL
ncbi:MAG: hypothetical protein AABZ23_02030 [Deltaproteobacteria bacterium]